MTSLLSSDFSVAAHEYSHYVLHASGLKLPTWLQEGLAEEFSTLRISGGTYLLGGDLPARTQTLQRNRRKLVPIADLLSATDASVSTNGRKEAELFYAESWALTDMLVASPAYAPRFRDLISQFEHGAQGAQPFETIYKVSLEKIYEDLSAWISEFASS